VCVGGSAASPEFPGAQQQQLQGGGPLGQVHALPGLGVNSNGSRPVLGESTKQRQPVGVGGWGGTNLLGMQAHNSSHYAEWRAP
jgi:hypothetical protein